MFLVGKKGRHRNVRRRPPAEMARRNHFFGICQICLQKFMLKLIFLTKNSILGENWPKLSKICVLEKIFSMLDPNLGIWRKFLFLTQISIFDPNFNFWPKFRLLTQTSIFDPHFNFWPKFQFLTQISIFDPNFNFWQKLDSGQIFGGFEPKIWKILANLSAANYFKLWPRVSQNTKL